MKEEEIPSPPRANDPTPEPPPAGTRWMAVLRWALLCVLVAFAAGAILWFFRVGPFGEIQREGDALYQCPMHPEIVQDRPGSCPICGMDLVPVEGAAQKPPTAYTCPMHPEIVQDHPGRCPICGMDLVPVSPEPQHASADQPARSLLPGHSEVHLDSRRVQMIGLRTAPVERRTLSGEIRTVAVATADESRLSMVHTKVPGWIDRLPVSRVGEYVRKGQVVARLHSLELVAAQEDFLAALRNAQTLKETAGGDAKRVLQAARNRLALWGMSDREIDLLAATGEVRRSVEDLGLRGVKFHPSLQEFFPDDHRFYPLWETIARLGVPALFHSGMTGFGAGSPGGGGIKTKYCAPIPHIDDLAADFPELTIIMAHPAFPWVDEQIAVLLHKPNVFMDLSGYSPKYFPPQLVQYANTLLQDKVMFGSDYPMIMPERWLSDFEAAPFREEVRPKILRDNAVRVLRLNA